MTQISLITVVLDCLIMQSVARQVLLVGLYKDSGASVLSYSFDGSTSISSVSSANIGASPSWIIPAHHLQANSDREQNVKSLFVVSETGNSVASLSLDCNGSVAETSRVNSQGASPVFLATDRMNDHLLVANYGGGSVAVLPISWKDDHATLGNASQTLEFGAKAHAHSAYFAPFCGPDCVFVPTLGLDEVQQLNFRGGKLSKAYEPLTVPAQQGPRHLAFHPSLPIAVLANEGSATANVTIELLGFTEKNGLKSIATYKASGPYSAPNLYPAEVLFTERGDFVLVSVRDSTDQKRDGVAVFKVEKQGAKLSFVDYASVGHYPRSMALSETGVLIVGNQKGNSLSFLTLDFKTGTLTSAREDLEIDDSPAFVGIFDLPAVCDAKVDAVVV